LVKVKRKVLVAGRLLIPILLPVGIPTTLPILRSIPSLTSLGRLLPYYYPLQFLPGTTPMGNLV